MRFMVIVKADKRSEAGILDDERTRAEFAEMEKYNDELVKAGVMLAGEGLKPSSAGTRIRFDGERRTVVDGPFPQTKELVSGFWLWEVKSKDEAIAWLKRAPFREGEEVELRPLYESADFAPIDPTGELARHEEALRRTVEVQRHGRA